MLGLVFVSLDANKSGVSFAVQGVTSFVWFSDGGEDKDESEFRPGDLNELIWVGRLV